MQKPRTPGPVFFFWAVLPITSCPCDGVHRYQDELIYELIDQCTDAEASCRGLGRPIGSRHHDEKAHRHPGGKVDRRDGDEREAELELMHRHCVRRLRREERGQLVKGFEAEPLAATVSVELIERSARDRHRVRHRGSAAGLLPWTARAAPRQDRLGACVRGATRCAGRGRSPRSEGCEKF